MTEPGSHVVQASVASRHRFKRRTLIVIAAASTCALAALAAFVWTTPDAAPFGDEAVIQLYTLEALRGFVKVGPYSQFGWHHPGPLYFYCLAPFYELAGWRTIGLVVGALAINAASLIAAERLARRNDSDFAAAAVVCSLTIFVWRAQGTFGSIWNAHVVILPFAALVVSCAALAAGDVAAFPVAVLTASFVAQTDIGLAPSALVILALAMAVIIVRQRQARVITSVSFRLAVGLGALVWLPPLYEQATGTPGNFARTWHYFFSGPHAGQSLRTAFSVWSDVTTAFVRTHLSVGWGASYEPKPSWFARTLAVLQLAVLTAALARARRAGRTFISWFCCFGIVASLASGWSITHIDDDIGDYQVFWMTVLGALAWAAMLATFAPRAFRAMSARTLRCAAATAVVAMAIQTLLAARAYAVEQQDGDVRRKSLALDVVNDIERQQLRRPLFHLTQDTWLDAACIILQAYKHHSRLAVDRSWTPVFGEGLAPTGREDVEFYIATRADSLTLSRRAGDRIISAHGGLFVHRFNRLP